MKTKTILVLGGDGYLGWSLGLALAVRTDWNVVLVDSLIKREWEHEVNAKVLVPLKKPAERLAEFKRLYKKTNLSFEKVDLLDHDAVVAVIKKYKPFSIINAAQQPSAPFAMMNAKNAAATFSNNIIGHSNILWAIAATDKSINYIKLGSSGVYMGIDTDFVPLKKIDLTFKLKGKAHDIKDSHFPMYATDFYHQSKITDFYISELCAELWGLKTMTVQQSTIFGATIPENNAPAYHGLSTRFNYDAVFSTVLNRFVCQLAIDHPLTIYGDGSQKTGLISLTDTVDNFIKFANMEIKPGSHIIVHNYTHRLSIKEIAQTLTDVAGATKISFIKNPRKEPTGKLNKKLELHPIVKTSHLNKQKKLEKELSNFVAFARHYKHRIDPSIIMPNVHWRK